MDISSLFQQLHGILDVEALVPLANRRDLVKKKQYDELVNYLEVDPKNLYFDPNNQLHCFIYYDGLLYLPLYAVQLDALKMMHIKEMLQQQLERLHKLEKAKDYDTLFHVIDKKILIPAFVKYYKTIPTDQVYDVFVDLYQRTEYGFDKIPKDVTAYAFQHRVESSDWHDRIEQLRKKCKKEFVKIYRGETHKSTPNNMSWTLKKQVAQFFANRFNSQGKILEKTVKVSDILDYITSRSEEEVLYLS